MKFFWRYRLDHVLFWMITVLFYGYVNFHLAIKAGFGHYLIDIIVRNGVIVIVCYSNIYFFSPRYLKKGLYRRYAVAVLLCLLLCTGIKNIHDGWLPHLAGGNPSKQSVFYRTYYNFSILLFYLVFTMALDTSKQWFRQQVTMKRIQMENLQAELQYLKAQMNPHFLFNSINTIYFQIDKGNKEARTSLEKFAELLRYQLYECDEDTISIEREVEYLRSYVDLERLRKEDTNSIIFNVGNDVKGFALAPLLLLPFVENAFKHMSGYGEKPGHINVSLQRQNGHFEFEVSNSKNGSQAPGNSKGIGLKNVQRRLDLLYGSRYSLHISSSEHCHMVNLKIQLK